MTERPRARVVRGSEGTWLWWLGHAARYYALGSETDETYCLARGTAQPGPGPPPHRHDFHEGFYVLGGQVEFRAGNQTLLVSAGGFLNIASNVAHTFRVPGPGSADILLLASPTGFDRFQLEAGRRIDGPDAPLDPVMPADIERMRQVAPRYTIDLNPPASAFETAPRIALGQAGQGKRIALVGDLYTILADSADTDGHYAIFHAVIPPGGGPPPHVHSREEEGFFVLSGELTFVSDGQRFVAGPQTYIGLPRGTLHSFKNEAQQPATALIFVAPGGLERMFEEAGTMLTDPSARPSPPTPDDIARLLKLAPRYGIEIRLSETPASNP